MGVIIAAMDGMLQPPAVTTLDAVASIVSLLVYLVVALLALARVPGDPRTRVFFVVALASAIPYALSPLQWWKGTGAYTPSVITLTAVAFTIGTIALFHFTQVFPARRPWIRAHFAWLAASYALLPVPVAGVTWIVGSTLMPADGNGGLAAVSDATVMAMLLCIPALVVIGLVFPFGGVMSLFKSWQESKAAGDVAGRETTFWMLISQMAGGVLAVLVLPLLHLAGIGPPWATVIAALTYAFGIVMPLTFAAAVWGYGALDSDAPPSTPQFRDAATPD
jgi:hypothetical protein